MSAVPWRPTRPQLEAARDVGRVPDVVAPGLQVLFVGINPGLYSGAVGHHFARPGNRFWKVLHLSGFTPRVYSPFEEARLLEHRLGITNLVPRTTAAAAELSPAELQAGGRRLRRKVAALHPAWLAVLGVEAYRVAFGVARARVGPISPGLGSAHVWLLPNPSGLNAHYQLESLAAEFRRLREAVSAGGGVAVPGDREGDEHGQDGKDPGHRLEDG